MNWTAEPDKKIVSKGEYVKTQGKRAGIGFLGAGLFLLAVIVLFLAISVGETRLEEYSFAQRFLSHNDKALPYLQYNDGSINDTILPEHIRNDARHSNASIEYQAELYAKAIAHPKWWVENGLGLMGFSLVIFLLVRLAWTSMTRVENIVPGVPLTRANTGNLPAPQSLVRASEAPVQEQQSMLLRAVGESHQTPPEQLVRAAGGRE